MLDELHPASYRGVLFNTSGASTSSGRKTAVHTFVNSDEKDMEDLGKDLRVFTITASVSGPDYISQRDKLIDALLKPGVGVLVHPNYGRVNVVALPYTVEESESELGEAKFSLVFNEVTEEAAPIPIAGGVAAVSAQADVCIDELATETADTFSISDSFAESYASAKGMVTDVTDRFSVVSRAFAEANDAVSTLASDIDEFRIGVASFINQPLKLANGVLGLFDQTRSVVTTARQRIDVVRGFLGFNDGSDALTVDANSGNAITVEAAEIGVNERTVTNQVRLSALAISLEAVVQSDFTTADELESVLLSVQNSFDDLITDETPVGIRNAFEELRVLVAEHTATRKQFLPKVSDIQIPYESLTAQQIAFAVYGDAGRVQDIIDVNNPSDVIYMSGTVGVPVQIW